MIIKEKDNRLFLQHGPIDIVVEAIGKDKYLAYNYTGMSIINTEKLIKNNRIFATSSNFEMNFFPFFIKKYKTNLIKLLGFWHSIDNEKDISAINDKKKSKKKFLILSKIKKKLSNQ